MATRTFHISFPIEWAKEIEKEMEKRHFTPTEYFKHLYRQMRQEREYKDFRKALKCYEEEKKSGKLKKMESFDELFD